MSLLIFIPFTAFAQGVYEFKSVCGAVNYEVTSYCKANNLRGDQDKLDIPICEKQIVKIGQKVVSLSSESEVVERVSKSGELIKMMGYVYYGASCKNNNILFSASGGCNACGEKIKAFSLAGESVKINSMSLNLNPMEDIIPYIPRNE